MSLSATLDLIQTRNRGISGIRTAPAVAAYPEQIAATTLPLALTWPVEGQWSQQATGALERQDRTLEIQVFVTVAQAGRGLGPRLALCCDLIQAFGESYRAASGLLITAGLTIRTDEGGLRDTGAAILRYAGVEFHGFQFTVRVYELT